MYDPPDENGQLIKMDDSLQPLGKSRRPGTEKALVRATTSVTERGYSAMQLEISNEQQCQAHPHYVARWIAVTRIVLILVVNIMCVRLSCYASTISATSTSLAAVGDIQTDSRNWYFSTPKPGDTITFTSGDNIADGLFYPERVVFGPASKFNFGPGGPTGKFFGFGPIGDPGPAGSIATTAGQGQSSVAVIPIEIFNPLGANYVIGTYTTYSATWAVGANGTLGKGAAIPLVGCGAKLPAPCWVSRATGKDPWNLTSSDLVNAGVTGSTFDMFFMAELNGGDYSPLGGISFDVSAETAAGTSNLLDISLTDSGASVTGDNPTGLSIFRLSALDGPFPITGTLTSLSEIQSQLQNDVASDRSVDTPLALGFLLTGIPVPSGDIGDGAVARVSVSTAANDAAAVPEPSTLVLFGTGAVSVLACARMRGRRLFDRV